MKRRVWLGAFLVFAVSLAVRLVFLHELEAHDPTFASPDGGDYMLYDRLAAGVPAPARAYFHSPLYIGFLHAAYSILGRSPFGVRLIQHVLGAITATLSYAVAWRLFARPRLAIASGLLAGLFGPAILYEGQLGVDGIVPLFLVGSVLTLLEAERTRRIAWLFAAGVLIGLGAAARPVALVWLPVVGIAIVTWRSESRGMRARSLAAFGLGAALVVAPIAIRNWVVERDFVLISANGGLNLYIGNNPHATGAYVAVEGLWFRPGDVNDDYSGFRVAREALHHAPTSAELSRWWTGRAVDFIRHEPWQAAALGLRKLRILVNGYEYPQLQNYYAYADVAPILRACLAPAWLLVPGLVGLVLGWRSKRRPVRLVVALVVAFALSFVPFFVVGRYRAPWAVLLTPFAAFAIASLADAIRARSRPHARVLVVLGAAALTLVFWPLGPVPSRAAQYLGFANASLRVGHPAEAIAWAERARTDDPNWPAPCAMLGRLHRERGDLEGARADLTEGAALFPHDGAVASELGKTYLALHEWTLARGALERAISDAPAAIDVWLALADACDALGSPDDARAARASAETLRDSRGPGFVRRDPPGT